MVTALEFDRGAAHRHAAQQIADLLNAPNPVPTIPEAHMGDFERYAIVEALRHTRGNIHEAAKILHISRRTLQMRLRAWRGEVPSRW